jgi:hypothetical protein
MNSCSERNIMSEEEDSRINNIIIYVMMTDVCNSVQCSDDGDDGNDADMERRKWVVTLVADINVILFFAVILH